MRAPSWRRVKKMAKMSLKFYRPPLKILKREGYIWFVTPHPNFWCSRYWGITIFNAEKLTGMTNDEHWIKYHEKGK